MEIQILRDIGRKLFSEIHAKKSVAGTPLGKGASGDITYQIDRIAEDIILSGLEASGEALTVVSEEIGIKEIRGGGRKVLVDPIDGSRNAVSGLPFYCASIAVANGNKIGDIETAYIINLINRDEFWAERGKGAFLNGENIRTQEDDIFHVVSYEAQLPQRDIPDMIAILSASKKTRCFGSTALDLAYLAAGAVSVFVNPSLSRSIDFAGGWLLVKEAGGIFTDTRGKEIDDIQTSLEKSTSLLVSGNMLLHKKALTLLR